MPLGRPEGLSVQLLGGFAVLVHGRPAGPPPASRAAAVLAHLALHEGSPVPRSQLASRFWPESAGAQARANLRKALLTLRLALPAIESWVDLGGAMLQWRPGCEVDVDVARFRRAVAAGTARSLAAALQMYGAGLLPDWRDEWLVGERDAIHRSYIGAVERLAELHEVSGRHVEALRLAERLCADDPLSEEHLRRLMRLHALCGDLAAAERVYRAFADLSKRELGVRPSPATEALRARLRETAAPRPVKHLGQALQSVDAELFVGRDAEVGAFRDWLTATPDMPAILELHGPGGIGKSTLVRAFGRMAQRLGWSAVYVDLQTAPRTEDGLLLALGGGTEAQALAALNAARPLVLFDACEALGELGRYLRERVLPQLVPQARVVMAGRQPLDAGWRLGSPWRRIIRTMALHAFTRDESRSYVLRRGIADPALGQQLTDATAGNPLALSLACDLVLRLGAGDLRAAAAQWRFTVHDLVGQLLRDLPDDRLRAVIEAAAVLRTFDQRSLTAVAGGGAAGAFDALSHLAVVRPAARGLALHDDVRRLVAEDLRWRDPSRFAQLRLRALAHLHERAVETPSAEERAWLANERLFHSGEALIQSLLFPAAEPGQVWMEDARPEDHGALRAVWAAWRRARTGMPPSTVLRRALEMALAWRGTRVRVARGRNGDALGFTAMLPICRESTPILLASPNSAAVLRARFRDDELRQLPAAPADSRLFFIRYLVYGEREGDAVRSELLRDFTGTYASGGVYYSTVAEAEIQQLMAALPNSRPMGRCQLADAPYAECGFEFDLSEIGFDGWIERLLQATAHAHPAALRAPVD